MCSLLVGSVTWMSWYLFDVLTIEMPNREESLLVPLRGFDVSVQLKETNSPSVLYRKPRLLTGLLWKGQLHKIKGTKSYIELNLFLWKILEMDTEWSWILRTCELHGPINIPIWYCIYPVKGVSFGKNPGLLNAPRDGLVWIPAHLGSVFQYLNTLTVYSVWVFSHFIISDFELHLWILAMTYHT